MFYLLASPNSTELSQKIESPERDLNPRPAPILLFDTRELLWPAELSRRINEVYMKSLYLEGLSLNVYIVGYVWASVFDLFLGLVFDSVDVT